MKITLTDRASKHFEKLLKDSNKEYLKFDRGGMTCCYFVHSLEPSDIINKDHIIESGNFKILVNDEIANEYETVNIDYEEEGFSQGIQVEVF